MDKLILLAVSVSKDHIFPVFADKTNKQYSKKGLSSFEKRSSIYYR